MSLFLSFKLDESIKKVKWRRQAQHQNPSVVRRNYGDNPLRCYLFVLLVVCRPVVDLYNQL